VLHKVRDTQSVASSRRSEGLTASRAKVAHVDERAMSSQREEPLQARERGHFRPEGEAASGQKHLTEWMQGHRNLHGRKVKCLK
jgi:hypothetical protein